MKRRSHRMLTIIALSAVPLVLSACAAPTSSSTKQATASPRPTQASPSPSATPTPKTAGTIEGTLIYPSSVLPAQQVVAFPVGGGAPISVTTAKDQSSYKLEVPAGTYHVLAYVNRTSSAAYDKAMQCWGGSGGANSQCTDTTLVDVTVAAGQVVADINPQDWYNQDQTWPKAP